jgi:hypothetical protein
MYAYFSNHLQEHRKSDGSNHSSQNKSGSSHYSLDEDGYGYVTSKPRNVQEVMGNYEAPVRYTGLPANCFKKMEVAIEDDDLDSPDFLKTTSESAHLNK